MSTWKGSRGGHLTGRESRGEALRFFSQSKHTGFIKAACYRSIKMFLAGSSIHTLGKTEQTSIDNIEAYNVVLFTWERDFSEVC